MPDLVFIGHIGQFETYIKTHCVHSPVNDPGQPWTLYSSIIMKRARTRSTAMMSGILVMTICCTDMYTTHGTCCQLTLDSYWNKIKSMHRACYYPTLNMHTLARSWPNVDKHVTLRRLIIAQSYTLVINTMCIRKLWSKNYMYADCCLRNNKFA